MILLAAGVNNILSVTLAEKGVPSARYIQLYSHVAKTEKVQVF